MSCWPATIVGALSLGLIIFDLIKEQWNDLLYHGGIGVGLTGFFWLICVFLGEQISFGIFIIPAIVFLVFIIASWLFTYNLKEQGCCVKCLKIPKEEPKVEPKVESPSICPPVLKATTN